jgi:hypothetical protein
MLGLTQGIVFAQTPSESIRQDLPLSLLFGVLQGDARNA